MRSTDIYKELKMELERLVPAQSFVPNQIYRAMHRSQIWCALESDALLGLEELVIQQDTKVYNLLKTFKRISSITIEDYSDDIIYISPAMYYQQAQLNVPLKPIYYTKVNDSLWFMQSLNDFVGKKIFVLGFLIPTLEPSETQELELSAIYDQAIKLRALYYLLPLTVKERASFSLESVAEITNISGKTTNEFTDIKNSNIPMW